jgi:hypothetical protein
MNTQTSTKPLAQAAMLAIEYRPKALPQFVPECEKRWWQSATVPAYAEPSAEISYGCVEWFRYDKHVRP